MKIADMHCDTISVLLERKRQGKEYGLRTNDCHVDLERLKKSGYLLQNFAVFVDRERCTFGVWEEAMEQIKLYEEELGRNRDLIGAVKCYADVEANVKAGRMSSLLTVEEGAVCGGDIKKLRSLYDKGVRMLTLTWNYPNELGHPNLLQEKGKVAWKLHRELKNSGLTGEERIKKQQEVGRVLMGYLNTPNTRNGLTEKGREFVAEMERLGMIVDVSHLSDAGFYDVLAHTVKPFVASHSNARAVCPCVRNLTNDMIRRLAERGGVTGLNYCADFLTQKPAGEANPGTIADIVVHARHIVNVGGIECLGLGSDFDGIDTHRELPGAEKMDLLWDAMEKAGFLPSQIDKMFYGNVLRLYRDVLAG